MEPDWRPWERRQCRNVDGNAVAQHKICSPVLARLVVIGHGHEEVSRVLAEALYGTVDVLGDAMSLGVNEHRDATRKGMRASSQLR